MTEAEWERCTDRRKLLDFVGDKVSQRKLRLFAVACCRQQWELFPDKPHRKLIETAEQFTDGAVTAEKLQLVDRPTGYSSGGGRSSKEAMYLANAAGLLTYGDAPFTAERSLRVAVDVSNAAAVRMGDHVIEFEESEREIFPQITLLHDIVGNPFYPEAVEPAWLTDTVVQFARVMYESHDFSAMPILADALQDAGCDNHIILNHCQGRWPHVRGCWVVDLILGKE